MLKEEPKAFFESDDEGIFVERQHFDDPGNRRRS